MYSLKKVLITVFITSLSVLTLWWFSVTILNYLDKESENYFSE